LDSTVIRSKPAGTFQGVMTLTGPDLRNAKMEGVSEALQFAVIVEGGGPFSLDLEFP
jgi:hypothetical protein